MRKKLYLIKVLLFSTSLVAAISITQASEQPLSEHYINVVQGKQAESIEQGIRLGTLTPKESKELLQEQQNIQQLERTMRNDGMVTQSELRELFTKLEASRKHINKLSRNSISTFGESASRPTRRNDEGRVIRDEDPNRHQHIVGR